MPRKSKWIGLPFNSIILFEGTMFILIGTTNAYTFDPIIHWDFMSNFTTILVVTGLLLGNLYIATVLGELLNNDKYLVHSAVPNGN
ncbi:MAG: hypothetical protein ACFFBD_02645 [Candidatus Hodarchaeota archaeon]